MVEMALNSFRKTVSLILTMIESGYGVKSDGGLCGESEAQPVLNTGSLSVILNKSQ